MDQQGYQWYGEPITKSNRYSMASAAENPDAPKSDPLFGKKKKNAEREDLFNLLMLMTVFGNPLGPKWGPNQISSTRKYDPKEGRRGTVNAIKAADDIIGSE